MIDHCNLIAAPIATVALGRSMSAGAVLLACGVKGQRYIAEHAYTMIHEIQTFLVGNSATIENDGQFMKRLNDRLMGILAKNTGNSAKEIKAIFRGGDGEEGRPEAYMDATESVAFGLADKILDKETFKRLFGARA